MKKIIKEAERLNHCKKNVKVKHQRNLSKLGH